jgi:hypothetical protein
MADKEKEINDLRLKRLADKVAQISRLMDQLSTGGGAVGAAITSADAISVASQPKRVRFGTSTLSYRKPIMFICLLFNR